MGTPHSDTDVKTFRAKYANYWVDRRASGAALFYEGCPIYIDFENERWHPTMALSKSRRSWQYTMEKVPDDDDDEDGGSQWKLIETPTGENGVATGPKRVYTM